MIVIINCPFTKDYDTSLFIKYNLLIKNLKKICKVYIYNTKFSFADNKTLKFTYNDLKLESVAEDIFNKFGKHKIYLIGLEHGSPYALYYSYHYSKYCCGVLCFPLRGYNKYGLSRRIHKYKDNNGWNKHITSKYDIDDYFINLNNVRLQELLSKQTNKEEHLMLFLAVELNLRKQYKKLPDIFKVPTIIFIRLDLDTKAFIDRNLTNKTIADMKKLTNEHDTMIYSCVGSIEKVNEVNKLISKNSKNNNLIIYYLGDMDNKDYDYGKYVTTSIKLLLNL